jgi:hypothetical protein
MIPIRSKMRISGVNTFLSPNADQMIFIVSATEAVPPDAVASVVCSQKNDDGIVVEITIPTEVSSVQGDTFTATINITRFNEILDSTLIPKEEPENPKSVDPNAPVEAPRFDKVLEDFRLVTSFGTITIKLNGDEKDDPTTTDPDEIEEQPDPETKMKVMRLWQNYQYTGRREFWISNAYLDTTKAVTVDVEISPEYGYPGIYSPTEISQDDFDALLASSDLKEKNGHVYAVQSSTGLKQIAVLFSNVHRTYADYFSYDEVYQLSPSPPYSAAPTRTIQSQDIVKIKDSIQQFEMEELYVESPNFFTEIYELLNATRHKDVAFDRRTLTTSEIATQSFSIESLGSTNTDYQ